MTICTAKVEGEKVALSRKGINLAATIGEQALDDDNA